MIVKNVSAVLKDIKVTKKGINLTLEDVRLKGEELQDLASLIGEIVQVGVDIPQLSIFEDEDVNASDAYVTETPTAELSLDEGSHKATKVEYAETYSDADIENELGLS